MCTARACVMYAVLQAMSRKEQQEMMSIFTDTFPLRIRDIWVIHQPWYFSVFWGLVKVCGLLCCLGISEPPCNCCRAAIPEQEDD
jgi:hypothetical protein